MAQKQKQKRPSPLDDPPTASSSDSEQDQQPSSDDERPSSQQQQQHEEDEASSEDLEDDEEDDDEEEEEASPLQPSSKKPPPRPANSHSRPSFSESATESDSESDSESDPPAAVANPKVKPLASKPMEQTPKAKPQPSAASAPARSASKRPGENNGHVTDPKRAKKKVTTDAGASDDDTEENGKKPGDDSKKLFQRIWSEEDEIAILKGMAEFTSKTGADPLKETNAFHDFVKKSLRVDASSNQLKQKIRRLKKKFETNAGKGKNGEGPSFSKPHDQKAFELSKKVWANGVVEKAKPNGKAGKIQKEGSRNNVASPKPKPEPKPEPQLPSMDTKEAGKMDIDEKPDEALPISELIRFDNGVGLSGLSEDFLKRGVELIGASKRAELEGRWKKLQGAELELYVKRAELIEYQARLILEAYKSSSH